ncbi:MAG: hypothetical protein U5N85_13470 [Arcicella sp.]|nr:hypothetical protein [Arcicella sp.]
MNQRNIILKNAIIISLLALLSCSSKDTRNNPKSFYTDFFKTPYIISVKDSLIEHRNDSLSRLTKFPVPPPPIPKNIGKFGMYCGNFNVIFYANNRVFFHNKQNLFHACGTGISDEEIDFLDIQPDDIIEVSGISVMDIIQKNKDFSNDIISIASLSDTIQNPFFDVLIDSLNKNKLKRYFVRRATEEEQNVLDSKLKHKFYQKEDYKWTMKYRNVSKHFFSKKNNIPSFLKAGYSISLLQKLINPSNTLPATYTGGNHSVFLISALHFAKCNKILWQVS